MAHVAPIYPNFARGEVSPLMFGRIDIEQYPTCLDKCRNAYIRPYGCATRLTGTEYISSAKNNGKARLLKFVFSPTDSYIIECGAGYFRFYQNGGAVLKTSADAWVTEHSYSVGNFVSSDETIYYCVQAHTSGTFADDLESGYWVEQNIYEVPNTYYEDQLESIQYVQLDDILKLTCLPHNGDNSTAKPKELIRNASNNWTFRNVTFTETPYLDQNTTSTTLTPSAVSGSSITITASANYFNADMVGTNFWIGTKVTNSSTNKDVQGYVSITGYTSPTQVTARVRKKLSGTEATTLWGEGAFSDYRGYPSCVALYDGRLWYGRTPTQPRNLYGSKPYAYETFTPAVDNEDDAGINIQLATNANGDGSDIKWIIGASFLLCGTYGGEFVIRASGDGAITPTDISARQRTNWGGEPVQPIVAGTFVHFIQRNGNKLRQFQYDYYYDAYKAVDVSIFSEHLLESPIKQMALQKNPDSIIYLMREDGKVVMLTLEQDQSVQAWSLLEDLGAKVESIQTIPSFDGNYDEVYMLMNRQTLGTILTVTSSNPNLSTTNTYSGKKGIEGTEEIMLYYNGTNGVWTSPDSTALNTKLTVTSSNAGLTVTNNYKGTKASVGTATEVLKFLAWTPARQYVPSNAAGVIAYGKNKFVSIGTGGYISTSSDGINWGAAQKNLSTSDTFASIAFGNNKFVSVGKKGYVATSSNGTSWSLASTSSILADRTWTSVIYGNNKFVTISISGRLSTSTNGTSWTTTTTPSTIYNKTGVQWKGIAYGNNKYVIISAAGHVSTSSDASSWNAYSTVSNLGNRNWNSILYDGTKFIALSEGGYISTSTNGTTWTEAEQITNLSSASGTWNSLATDGVKIVALNTNGNASYYGLWESETTGNTVDIKSSNYAISITGTPQVGDELTCVWNTITNYVNLNDYQIEVTGTPENEDTLTLTYTTSLSGSSRYIERMLNPITPDNQNEWWYVRSGLKYDGFKLTEGINLTLSANSGEVTATASDSIFISSMVGNRIRFVDSDYNILGEGTITEYTSVTEVTLNITTYFQSSVITGGEWGISTDSLSGLSHLNGLTVQVYADCISQEEKKVADGNITIDDAFIAVVGLPYQSYITTMPMEAGSQNGTAVGKRKRISEMAIRVWNSLGVKVGRDLNHLYDTIYQQKEPFTGVIPNIKYNQGWVWDANITVEQSRPYPMNILSIAPIVTEVDK